MTTAAGAPGGGPVSPASRHLLDTARAWAADDPDPQTRAELEALRSAAEAGDEAATEELSDAMSGLLRFGTAGLRGRLGGGPNRMNRAVVIRAAAGLAAYLRSLSDNPFVVIGYDARTNSEVFARDTAAVVVGAGGRAAVLPRPLPTPVLAYAVRRLGAAAGVMVTASHNPPQDNGYKVYLADGAQIAAPVDELVAAQIAEVTRISTVPRAPGGWERLGERVVLDYLADAAATLEPGSARELRVVHTAMHGVGAELVRRAFAAAGFDPPIEVAAQAEPDPEFPTLAFPNPEEPGALDRAFELAERVAPDLVIANDPDADRCAVAVADHRAGTWRMLRGDELGALLGSHLLTRGAHLLARDARPGVVPSSPGCVFASTIVSSRLLGAMCRRAGVRHVETPTGFKWIGRVPGLRYGYEEALGYCVDPEHVTDKDGVTAALLVAELAATCRARGETLLDRLDALAREHGVYATDAFSVPLPHPARAAAVLERLRSDPPGRIGGVPVERLDDLAAGAGGLPPTPGLRWFLRDGSRVVVRPSGTEPKLKVYLEVVEPVPSGRGLAAAREHAAYRLVALRADAARLTAV